MPGFFSVPGMLIRLKTAAQAMIH